MNSREKAAEKFAKLECEGSSVTDVYVKQIFLAGSDYEQARVKPVIDAAEDLVHFFNRTVHWVAPVNRKKLRSLILQCRENLSKYQEGENGKV